MTRTSRRIGTAVHQRRLTIAVAVMVLASLLVVRMPTGRAAVVATPVRQVGGPGHAALYGWGAATAADGSVLLGDYWNYRIAHYAKNGTFLGDVVTNANAGLKPNQHQSPYGIAVDPATGNVYFGDVDNNATIDEYSATGTFLREWGGKGSGVGKFQYPAQ